MPTETEEQLARLAGLSGTWKGAEMTLEKMAAPSVTKSFLRGAVSAWTPYEPMPHLLATRQQIAARESMISMAQKHPQSKEIADMVKMTRYERMITKGTRAALRYGGRQAMKWFGPLFSGIRMAGVSGETQGLGFGETASKYVRAAGEETMWTAGMVAGGVLGAKVVGGALAAAGTTVAPGVGTIAGAVVGAAIGFGIGAAGSWAFNAGMDVAEAPIRMASAGWKYFREAGKRSTRLELGGGVSVANRSRQAMTMRQRALAQMGRSGINARSLLGQEASMMHLRG